jgi:hypothetical protein
MRNQKIRIVAPVAADVELRRQHTDDAKCLWTSGAFQLHGN